MKSMIVYGPDAAHMATQAGRMCQHLGLKKFALLPSGLCTEIDYWSDTLYLYESEGYPTLFNMTPMTSDLLASFAEVAQQINDAIPLTAWAKMPPDLVGEYNASIERSEHPRRWWDGNAWSYAYYPYYSKEEKFDNAMAHSGDTYFVEWRGLSQEPIKVAP